MLVRYNRQETFYDPVHPWGILVWKPTTLQLGKFKMSSSILVL